MYAGLCLGLLPCASAAASDPESVQLSIPDCADASGKQIAKLVALELASRENLRLEDSSEGLQASLRCTGDSAVISVRDPLRPAPLVLEMQLAQTQREARPRLLALAIAELIATSRLEQAPSPSSAKSRESALSVWLAAGLLRAYQPGLWAGAGAAGAAYRFGPIALGAELGFDWTSHQTQAVDISARAISLALAPSVVFVSEPLEWSAGVGARVGYVWLNGSASAPDFSAGSVSGVFVSPFLASAVRWPIDEHWAVRLSFELGYVVTPVRGLDADRAVLLELKGLRAAGLLGVGWNF